MKIGVIGNGFVGKATSQLACHEIELLIYDVDPKLCNPPSTTLLDLCNECNIIFISVPTPMSKTGECHLAILETVVNSLQDLRYTGIIFCRSTVPVGTCDRLNICFMPEFLTEKNYIQDFIHNTDWIFGIVKGTEIETKYIMQTVTELIETAFRNGKIKHNNINFTSNSVAEMTKLFRNCYLATKVSFCNEIYRFCQHKNIDYDTVSHLATLDPRITVSHTQVPGINGMFGFGGTCFPKDMASLRHQMQQSNIPSHIINAAIERNETIDRPEKDWCNDVGRATI